MRALLLLIILGVIWAITAPYRDQAASTNPTVTKTPEIKKELTRAEKIASGFFEFEGSHKRLRSWTLKSLKDPDSFEHIDTRFEDKGDHLKVYMKYRAKNSFGGYSVEMVVARCTIDGAIIEVIAQGPI